MFLTEEPNLRFADMWTLALNNGSRHGDNPKTS